MRLHGVRLDAGDARRYWSTASSRRSRFDREVAQVVEAQVAAGIPGEGRSRRASGVAKGTAVTPGQGAERRQRGRRSPPRPCGARFPCSRARSMREARGEPPRRSRGSERTGSGPRRRKTRTDTRSRSRERERANQGRRAKTASGARERPRRSPRARAKTASTAEETEEAGASTGIRDRPPGIDERQVRRPEELARGRTRRLGPPAPSARRGVKAKSAPSRAEHAALEPGGQQPGGGAQPEPGDEGQEVSPRTRARPRRHQRTTSSAPGSVATTVFVSSPSGEQRRSPQANTRPAAEPRRSAGRRAAPPDRTPSTACSSAPRSTPRTRRERDGARRSKPPAARREPAGDGGPRRRRQAEAAWRRTLTR